MALTVTFAMSDDSMDPLDTSKTLVVTTSGVSTGSASFANPQLPSNSVMNVGSFFNLFPSDGTATVQAALTGTNLVAPFVAAVNTMFQVVPDSGKLTPGLTVLFPPSSMDFPAGGGFRMGVSGRFVAQPSQATFPGTGPDPLPLPNLPATGMTFVCNDFLLNQIGWYASFSGAMNMTLPLDDSLPAQWNTSIFQNQLPALYNFAPDVPFIMTFTSTAEAPTHFTIVPAFQMTPAALATVNPGLPANVLAVLQPYKNQIFPSAEALSGFLNAELTTSDYAAYAASIVAGSSGFGFQVVSIYTVALVVPQHGVKTTAVAFSTVVTHQVDQFGMTNPTATTQAVTFNAMYASSSSYSVTSAPGLPFSVSDLNTLTSLTLDKDIDYVTTLLNKAGQQGASIPALPGFVMRNPSVVVTSNQILVTGDTTPS